MKKPRFVCITMTAVAALLILLLTLSIGTWSIQLTPQAHFVVRRGAAEFAFSDHGVRAMDRDSWWIGVPAGVPAIIVCLPPATFLYPTARSDTTTFQYGDVTKNMRATMAITVVAIPLVVPTTLATLLAAWVWWPHLRRTRARHCKSCDYNLTGNTSGRCPECGALPNV